MFLLQLDFPVTGQHVLLQIDFQVSEALFSSQKFSRFFVTSNLWSHA